jgi:hypothetical protein
MPVQLFVFLGFWLWLLVDGRTRFFADPGTSWHLVVGRDIIATGQFPHTDRFSFTYAGQPWIASQWLGECGMALLYGLSGFDGLCLGIATLLAGFYTLAAHRLIRLGAPWWFAVLIVALAIKGCSFHFFARPHLATLVLLGWTFVQLCDFEAGRLPLRSLVWFIPVVTVWANIHGGVIGGILSIALAVAGWGLCWLVGLPTPIKKVGDLVGLSGLVLGCGAATLLNPYGLELLRTWARVMGSAVVHERIIEHLPLMRSPYAWAVMVFGVVYAAMLLSVQPRRLRVTWLLPLVWFFLAWSRVRNGPLFATVGVIALADMLPAVRWSASVYRWGNSHLRLPCNAPERPGWRAVFVPTMVVLLAIGIQIAEISLPFVGTGWARFDPNYWPTDLLPKLRAYESSRPPGTPIFNDMKFGGFLIAHTAGLRVFIDDRCELYGDEWILAYGYAQQQDQSQVDRWAQKYGFDRALVVTGSSIDWYLRNSDSWQVVGETKSATLHERLTSRR